MITNYLTNFSKKLLEFVDKFILPISILVAIILMIDSFNTHIDDTFISARYAKNLVNGYGLLYNPGEDPVEGFSNPLWTITLAAIFYFFKVLGLDDLNLWAFSIKIFSGIFFLFSIMLLFRVFKELTNNKSLIVISLLFYSSNYLLVTNAIVGLETSQYLFLIVLFIYSVIKGYKHYISGLILGLLLLSRPEAILFPFSILLVLLYKKEYKKIIIPIFSLLIFSLYILFRVFYYQDFLPNTFYAKQQFGTFKDSFFYLLNGLLLYFTPILILLLLNLKNNRSFQHIIFFIPLLASQVFFIIWSTGDWMPGYRFIIPMIPLFLYIFVSLVEDLQYDLKFIFLLIIIILYNIVPLRSYKKLTSSEANSGFKEIQVFATSYVEAKNYLKSIFYDEKNYNLTLAISEAGFLPFFIHQKFLDLSNLNDNYLARLPGKHFGKIDVDYVFSKNVDYFVFLNSTLENGELRNNLLAQQKIFSDKRFSENYDLVKKGELFLIYKRK